MEYGIIYIGIWHIYWDMAYLLGYGIFIGIWMASYIYWDMASYLLEYVILFIIANISY